jgi:hypothetical protein
VGVKRGPLSLLSTIEELPERKSSGSGLETRDYGGILRADHATPLYPQKLALISPTRGSLGRYRSLAEFIFYLFFIFIIPMFNDAPGLEVVWGNDIKIG